jgi:epoxyqueuosine reductase
MKRAAADSANLLSSQIKQAAQRLGFELVGISPVKVPPHDQSFAQWLRQGLAGELDYMKRTEALRRDPQELVPWAISIISAGMNYYKSMPRPSPSREAQGGFHAMPGAMTTMMC